MIWLAMLLLAGRGTALADPPEEEKAAALPAPPALLAEARQLARKLASRPELPVERRALVLADAEKTVDRTEAERAGFTLVDLSDGWTPFIFASTLDEQGAPLPNRYRTIFLGLASNRSDADGQPLAAGEENYLELFGIQPTLSVLRARFLSDETDPCAAVDLEKIRQVSAIPSFEPKQWRKGLERLGPAAQAAFAEIEKRLACEGLMPKLLRHRPGMMDDALRQALVRFQHKHKLFDSGLRKNTVAALGRTLLENDHLALVRTLTERVVAAASILEDGTAIAADGSKGSPTYTGAGGERREVHDLVGEFVREALAQLGLETPAAALAFFRRHGAADFAWLHAVVRLPPVPEYYSPEMDLSVEIDRGDVIYDPPFDEKGRPSPYGRHRFPSLTVRVRYQGQLIPLVRWRTTIGGWRSDLAANGYEYFRYKGSDVGPRVWRNIVAGPVWIAPNSTPVRTLVKHRAVNGTWQTTVNYDEVGPGYLSAYGLVAAYNVTPGRDGQPDWDNGVRVHGSSEYRSLLNTQAYSHGCHRLMNHLAERLFSFVLRHRKMRVEGDKPLNFRRQFLWKDEVYELRLPTRGYHYVLDPPVPVNVLEGRIVGRMKRPIDDYFPKPGVKYPPGPPPPLPNSPEARAGGGE